MGKGLFECQFALLQKELELIDATIRQLDEITKGIKNWAIVTWTAAVGVALATIELQSFTWLTAAIPLLFWIVDGTYRRVQRTFIFRNQEVRDFVNSEEFRNAAEQNMPFSFPLVQMRKKRPGLKNNLIGVMLFRTVYILYLGLSGLSILAGL